MGMLRSWALITHAAIIYQEDWEGEGGNEEMTGILGSGVDIQL